MPSRGQIEQQLAEHSPAPQGHRKTEYRVPDEALEMLRLARKERAMRQRNLRQHPAGIFTGWGEHTQSVAHCATIATPDRRFGMSGHKSGKRDVEKGLPKVGLGPS